MEQTEEAVIEINQSLLSLLYSSIIMQTDCNYATIMQLCNKKYENIVDEKKFGGKRYDSRANYCLPCGLRIPVQTPDSYFTVVWPRLGAINDAISVQCAFLVNSAAANRFY